MSRRRITLVEIEQAHDLIDPCFLRHVPVHERPAVADECAPA